MVGERFVRSIHPPLKFGSGLLAPRGESLEPEAKCLPVDSKDDPEGQQRIFQGKAEQGCVAEADLPTRKRGEELPMLPAVVVDRDPQS